MSLDKNNLRPNKQVKLSTSLSQKTFSIFSNEFNSFLYHNYWSFVMTHELIEGKTDFDSFIALLVLRFVWENTFANFSAYNLT